MAKRNRIQGKNANTHALKVIHQYKIESIYPIYYGSKIDAIIIKVVVNGYIPAYLSWEGSGGAVALWFKSPRSAYHDLMSAVWNASLDREEPGYECERFGMFDQWFFPCDNCLEFEPEDRVSRTDAEQDLYEEADRIFRLLTIRQQMF